MIEVLIGAVAGVIVAAILDYYTGWAEEWCSAQLNPLRIIHYLFFPNLGSMKMDWITEHPRTVIAVGGLFGGMGGLVAHLILSLV